MAQIGNIKKLPFFEKLILRWYTQSEGRVLLESYLLCSLIPVILYILPEWAMVSDGRVHRNGLVDYSMGLGAIFLAPILETIFIFVPILELCRYCKVKPIWTILGFALFFELLHTQRGFWGHLDSLSDNDKHDRSLPFNEKEVFFTRPAFYWSST